MDKLLETLLSQGPTVLVLVWIFTQLRSDVKEVVANLLRLLEKCMDDPDGDDTKGNKHSI